MVNSMISRFLIHGFRSCPEWKIEAWDRTLIFWKNGSGKSHILEWIHILCTWWSIYGKDTASENAIFECEHVQWWIPQTYRVYRENGKDIYIIGTEKVTKKKYAENMPLRTVFISPFDMNLLYFDPSIRRSYMDSILERSFEQFKKVKKDYESVMKQRNTLLKKIREWTSKREDLHYWNKKFSELASIYLLYREKLIGFIETERQKVNDKYSLHICYNRSIPECENEQEWIYKSLKENEERDILTWHTHIGPHRDDFSFIIKTPHREFLAHEYLSRWEMKMLLFSLKEAEMFFIEKYSQKEILLLIDDMFAELDDENSWKFLKSLRPYQTILTSQKPLKNEENWLNFICINLEDI